MGEEKKHFYVIELNSHLYLIDGDEVKDSLKHWYHLPMPTTGTETDVAEQTLLFELEVYAFDETTRRILRLDRREIQHPLLYGIYTKSVIGIQLVPINSSEDHN